MSRCRISEEDARDIYFDGFDERGDTLEAAREELEVTVDRINRALNLLLKDKHWQPDDDDLEAAEALCSCLDWHMTPEMRANNG